MYNSEIGVDDNLLSLARGPAHSALSYRVILLMVFDSILEIVTKN